MKSTIAKLIIPFLIFFVFLLFMTFSYYYLIDMKISLTIFCFNAIYSSILAILVTISKKKKFNFITIFIILLVFTLLYFSQLLYYNAFQSFWRLHKLVNIKEFFAVKDSIGLFFRYRYLVIFLPLFIFSVVWLVIFFKDSKSHVVNEKSVRNSILLLCVAVAALISINVKIIYVDGERNKKELINVYEYQKEYGMLDFLLGDIASFFPRIGFGDAKEKTVDEEIEASFALELENNKWTDIYKGKNLILITAESLSPFGIDEDLTPNLYSLKESGMYFDNYYSPNTNTFASEFAILNSFPYSSIVEKSTFLSNDTLPALFEEEGYLARAFHNNTKHFYDRENRMINMGFESFYGAEDLGIVIDERVANMGGDHPDDAELFLNSLNYTNFDGGPFFNYYTTVTGHGVYSQNLRPSLISYMEIARNKYPSLNDESIGYLAAQMKFDVGLGKLIENLTENCVLEQTVIVIVGDHYPYMLGNDVIKNNFQVDDNLEMYKTPFIIWENQEYPIIIEKPISNVDILPTLANMFGLEAKYSFGNDVFSKKEKEFDVEWFDNRNYSFITEEVKVDMLSDKRYTGITKDDVDFIIKKSYRRKELNDFFLSKKNK